MWKSRAPGKRSFTGQMTLVRQSFLVVALSRCFRHLIRVSFRKTWACYVTESEDFPSRVDVMHRHFWVRFLGLVAPVPIGAPASTKLGLTWPTSFFALLVRAFLARTSRFLLRKVTSASTTLSLLRLSAVELVRIVWPWVDRLRSP